MPLSKAAIVGKTPTIAAKMILIKGAITASGTQCAHHAPQGVHHHTMSLAKVNVKYPSDVKE